ncbi:hypothetical protein SAY86_009152 [Trapa natans]|uniref:Transcription factor CBF/NF-Y/archaeal histone domain-containing protein n=1 Tax=Trapa natans TaxID=22666 RepID=A0AAN7QCB3_TRANT|nr:hypothetical protein SAY86_009152 [Trapa natans]
MKQILPPSAKISKEAKETMQECASEFISFVTGEASERCQKEKRKTINGDDVCWALGALGFDEFVEPLKMYLNRYREIEDQKAANCNNNRGGPSSSSLNNNDGGEAGSCQSEQGRYPMFLKFNVAEKINDNNGFISRRC